MQLRTILLATTLGISLALAGTEATFAHDPGPGMMMQPGQGPMMGHGQGRMMQPGAGTMGQGQSMMMGPQMMHHGMMGQAHGMMGQGAQPGKMDGFHRLLSADDVKARLDKWLAAHLGERVKVGTVEVRSDFSIGAEVTTTDGSLIQRLIVDRRNGMVWRTE